MHRTAAVLKRFAALCPDQPLPKKAEDFSGEQRIKIAQGDPELAAILFGSASASLEASVLDGSWPDTYTAPSQEQINADRVREILALNPGGTKGHYTESGEYVEGKPADMTLMLELAALDPQAYQQQELIRNPPAAAPDMQQQLAQRQAQAEAKVASLNASRGLV